MKKLIISTSIVFLVNFVLQISADIFFSEVEGSITISNPINIGGTNYTQTIIISNYKTTSISGLEFHSKGVKIDSIYSSTPIKINILNEDHFVIDNFYGKSSSTLLIRFESKSDNSTFIPLNESEFGLTTKELTNNDKKYYINWLNNFIISLIISISYYIFFFYFNKKVEKMNKQIDEVSNKREEYTKSIEKQLREVEAKSKENNQKAEIRQESLEEKLSSIQNSHARVKLLLLTKARDLKKENDFYRELLLLLIKDPERMKNIEDEIRHLLKTYSTKSKMINLSSFDVVAGLLKKENKNAL